MTNTPRARLGVRILKSFETRAAVTVGARQSLEMNVEATARPPPETVRRGFFLCV